MTVRRGTTLAELLVALALASLLASAAATGLSQLTRAQREKMAEVAADDAVRLTRDLLRAELSHADADVRLFGDTAVQLSSLRVASPACDVAGDRLVLPAGAPAWSLPRAGDSVAVADTTLDAWRASVLSTRPERPSPACPLGGTRLLLSAVPPATLLPRLLPARVWRVVRYVLYRSGDGSWWLGERSCSPGCSGAQPVAGPLLAPSQGGLRLGLVLGVDGRPMALDVAARARVSNREARLAARLPLSTDR